VCVHIVFGLLTTTLQQASGYQNACGYDNVAVNRPRPLCCERNNISSQSGGGTYNLLRRLIFILSVVASVGTTSLLFARRGVRYGHKQRAHQ